MFKQKYSGFRKGNEQECRRKSIEVTRRLDSDARNRAIVRKLYMEIGEKEQDDQY